MRIVQQHCVRVISLLVVISWSAFAQQPAGQQIRWLSVGSLWSWISSVGAECEIGRTGSANQQMDGLVWPAYYDAGPVTSANYSFLNDNLVSKGFWIGTSNYFDRNLNQVLPAKAVCVGPRAGDADPFGEIMPVKFELRGRSLAPDVLVTGGSTSSSIGIGSTYDNPDVLDPTLPSDRMVVSVCNSSIGVTITRNVMAFSHQNHDNYFISDYTFKNTGIYDRAGHVQVDTLTGVYFCWTFRYAFGEEGYRSTPQKPNQYTGWGRNGVYTVDTAGTGGDSLRCFYSWYGKTQAAPIPDDIGLPAYWSDGHLTAAQHVGVVTLHADKSAYDKTDDVSQPRSTPFMGSDGTTSTTSYEEAPTNRDQYNAVLMQRKYNKMTEGHLPTMMSYLGGTPDNGQNNADKFGLNAGGYLQAIAYGPYTLLPGDSVRIVMAEGVNGLSVEKCYEVGQNWAKAKGITAGTPDPVTYKMPNGAAVTNPEDYKDAWVRTGVDSLKQTFRRALKNFQSNYSLPQPPSPPPTFNIVSAGNYIGLVWDASADESNPAFDGYEIYRGIGRSDTLYTKIFSCKKSQGQQIVHAFKDSSASRGSSYYYYVVSADNGTKNDVYPGVPLVSNKAYTKGAGSLSAGAGGGVLLRSAVPEDSMRSTIRVVPNPFDYNNSRLSSSRYTFKGTPDRLNFFGLPPQCTIKIYTERGDLVKTINHTNNSGDEPWDCVTEYNQIVVSGLYIAVFTTPDGKSVIRKFIVIR